MLQPYALATVAEMKRLFPSLSGTGRDAALEDKLNEASADVRRLTGRRAVFWAPTEDDDALVASVNVPTTAGTTHLTLLSQPTSPGRVPVVTVTDANRVLLAVGITVTLTITGTVASVV